MNVKNTLFRTSYLGHVKRGYLYNGHCIYDARGIAATGWHVPLRADAKILQNNILNDGGGLKETGTTYWALPNAGATNNWRFNAKGSGQRSNHISYAFSGCLGIANFWIWDYTNYDYWFFFLSYDNSVVNFDQDDGNLADGYSVRPVKDSTTLTNGQQGRYVGNDGRIYRTICIGNQEWLADNLCETKYANGDDIPYVVISDAAWGALTTGARCAYDNDLTNV